MTASPRFTLRVKPEELRCLVIALLEATGCSQCNAESAAEVFLEADLRGVSGQGIDYLPYMIDNLRKGNIDPRAEPRVARESGATVTIDGQRGPGQTAALLATRLVIEKAQRHGVGVAGIGNSTDVFMIGYYADLIASNGLAALVFSSGPPLVHPHGGVERMLSTNPIAFAFPTDGEVRVVCDVSTSAVSGWRLRQASYYKEELPLGSGVDAAGMPTRDASAIKQGAISPLGGHKGFALGFSVAALSGLLNASQVGAALGGWQAEGPIGYFGHTFIAIDPRALYPEHNFEGAVGQYVRDIKQSRKAPGVSEIRVPGERAARARKQSMDAGVAVLETTWQIISRLALEMGVQMPSARPAN